MRVLFVDDEPRVLHGLRRMLFSLMREWDMTFVESGAEALAHLAANPCDVIISDMRMPGMDGAELLTEVHRKHPNLIRIVLSGHTQLESALRALPIAHQFLSKPCSPDELKRVLALSRSLHERLSNPALQEIVSQNGQLPARPRLYQEVVSILADPDHAIVDVAEVIEQDVGLTTRVMHVVNSAFFGNGRRIDNMRTAVVRLGGKALQNLVLSAEVFDESVRPPRPIPEVDRLYARASAVAALAREMAPDRQTGDTLFLAGMMHEMGLMMMARVMPGQLAEVFQLAIDQGRRLEDVQRERFGVTHADLGACVLDWWGFPYELSEAVAGHLDTQTPEPGSVAAILRTAHEAVEQVSPLVAGATESTMSEAACAWSARAAELMGVAA